MKIIMDVIWSIFNGEGTSLKIKTVGEIKFEKLKETRKKQAFFSTDTDSVVQTRNQTFILFI